MESSKEQIEAQLCAYIDGELGDAERAEIERHLATNPQHKALIAELRRHSGLLQDLPRKSAPLELNEALCGQLERSALLNPSQEEASQNVLTINRWPQITAVAAVLMLAIGLGIVVYYVLPPSSPNNHPPLALDQNGPKGMITDGEVSGRKKANPLPANSDTDTRFLPNNGRSITDKDTVSNHAILQASIDPNATRAGEIKDGKLITAREVEDFLKYANLSLHGGNQAFNVDNSSLCLVVSTSNTAAASDQVALYFKTNGITYQNIDDSIALADGAAGSVEGRRNDGTFGYKTDRLYDRGRKEGGKLDAVSGPVASNDATGGAGFGGGGGRGNLKGGGGGIAGADTAAQSTEQRADAKTGERTLDTARGGDDIKEKAKATDSSAFPPSRAGAEPLPPAAPVPSDKPQPAKPGALADSLKSPVKAEEESEKIKRAGAGAAPQPREFAVKESSATASLGKSAVESGRQTERETPVPSEPKSEVRDPGQSAMAAKDSIRLRAAGRFDEQTTGRTVITARMSRRQVNELSEALSKEAGQRAQLTTVDLGDGKKELRAEAAQKPASQPARYGAANKLDITPNVAAANSNTYALGTPLATDPATPTFSAQTQPAIESKQNINGIARGAARTPAPATRPADGTAYDSYKDAQDKKALSESTPLNIKPDPMDEPVDVYIFVKDDRTTPTAPSIQQGIPRTADPTPTGENKK